MEEKLLKILESCNNNEIDAETAQVQVLDLFDVSERYLLVEWIDDRPYIDGSIYFDSMKECLEYEKNIPIVENMPVERTICTINDR